MENIINKKLQYLLLISFLFLTFIRFSSSSINDAIERENNSQTYLVLLEKSESTRFMESIDLHDWYQSFLPVSTFSSDQPRLLHAYRNVVTGFAAKLTAEEAKAVAVKEEVILARPERIATLHTTHTPNFLGLQQNSGFWKHSNYGKGVIIGVVDSGIAADHPSFSDKGMPPPPAKWRGSCELKGNLSCNKKLIGARNFATNSNDLSETVKHGTHVASTAAGSPVYNASFYGQANGTAIGIAPLAHLAMYKVSGRDGKTGESEVLAAMDAAIEDGVDVLSLSLGFGTHPFHDDAIAMGAYAATQKGIFVSCSAGNSGPNISSLSNEAPWILTVGASTVDRAIRATVLLGNAAELNGESLLQPKNFLSTLLHLIYAGENGNKSSALCLPGSLRNVDVKGKIVLCEGANGTMSKSQEVKANGGAAMIVMNEAHEGFITAARLYAVPASQVSHNAGLAIKAYINSTSTPKATILFKGTVVGLPEAPQVAVFSSKGPSVASPGILKPDIIGPGVRILAGWPVSVDNIQKFSMISGTSMSCPHLSGIAALLKSAHPDWSPAAIKSAIMTTAYLNNGKGEPITDQDFVPATVFDMGAGHVDPSKANDPGLVYDIQPDDYIPYLCGLGYSDKQIGAIVQHSVNCTNVASIPEAQLNYPSFSIKLGSSPQTYTRTVTNFGRPHSAYTLQLVAPIGVDVEVTPRRLWFSRLKRQATYSVTFRKNKNAKGSFAQGYLKWVSGRHNVGSPIAVMF